MHELGIYDTRTVEQLYFEPWMVGRQVHIKFVRDNSQEIRLEYFGILEWVAVNPASWYVKIANHETREIPRIQDGQSRHVEISVVLPANYMHVNADGTNTGDTDGF